MWLRMTGGAARSGETDGIRCSRCTRTKDGVVVASSDLKCFIREQRRTRRVLLEGPFVRESQNIHRKRAGVPFEDKCDNRRGNQRDRNESDWCRAQRWVCCHRRFPLTSQSVSQSGDKAELHSGALPLQIYHPAGENSPCTRHKDQSKMKKTALPAAQQINNFLPPPKLSEMLCTEERLSAV